VSEPGRADAAGWTVVVPVKSLSGAKTRLAPELSAGERAALARAFALDTIEAARGARAVARVFVVSDEPAIELALREVPRVEVVPELGPRGLAAAIAHGIAVAGAGRG
jgi:2-phospho-L-lactate guanylyltransferase